MSGYSKQVNVKGQEPFIKKIIEAYSDVVTSTMGPGSDNAIVQSALGMMSTMDGVTVMRHINPKEPFLAAIAQLLKDASQSTVSEVGDGTTTTVCLLNAIYSNWVDMIDVYRGCDRVSFFEGMSQAVDDVVNYLNKHSFTIEKNGEINRKALGDVALIACNGDKELAEMMADLVFNAGVNGRVIIQRHVKKETTAENYKGYTFDTEPLGRQHLRDRASEREVLVNPLFIISTDPLTTAEEANKILGPWKSEQKLRSKNEKVRPLVIMTAELTGGARSLISANAEREPIYVIKPPFGGREGWELMTDVQYITKTREVYSTAFGKPLLEAFGAGLEKDGLTEGSVYKEFGQAKECIITANQCSIIPMDEYSQEERISFLKKRIESLQSKMEIQFVKDRIAALDSGVGIVYVGAHSEVEAHRIEHYIDDVQQACFTALRGGVVPGAGRALFMASDFLGESMRIDTNLKDANASKKDKGFFHGYGLVLKSIMYPSAKIVANYNVVEVDEALGHLKALHLKSDELSDLWHGWSADGELLGDCFEHGVIDPVLVTNATVVNAVSVAKQLIGCKYILIEDRDTSVADNDLSAEVDKNYVKMMYERLDSLSR